MKLSIRTVNSQMLRVKRRYGTFAPLLIGLTSLMVIFFGAVYIYMALEGWNYQDAFYMVVLALSTVGFQEVHPLSDKGRIFTSALILFGVGNFAFLVGSFTQILVEGRLQTVWGRLRVQKSIDKLSNHIIVCGYGRIGSNAVKEILREGLPVVVIERNEDSVQIFEEREILYVHGDATKDDILRRAGLDRAKVLLTALSNEAANVYVTLTARQMNPGLKIVARADSEEHVSRLERAGANRVMLPHIIGGVRMAQSVLRPTVTNFLELAVRGDDMELQMEELMLSERSDLVGKNLIESKIRQRFNLIIISIKKADGRIIFNPGAENVLENGDTLILVGGRDNLAEMWEIV